MLGEAAIALALAAATFALYGPVLGLWWTHDDFFHLRHLLAHRPFWYLFDVAAYRETGLGLLTPLLFLSLDLDRRLFGIDPHPFYLHQLVALSASVAALYGVARIWLSRPWAAVAAWIVLVGPITASLVSLLMVRHYVEVIVPGALAVAAWATATRRFPGAAAWRWAWLSAALYFLACLAKEFAVPLVLLLPLLRAPEAARADGRTRLRLAVPHAVACGVYLALRLHVLQAPFSGYGFVVAPGGLAGLAVELPAKIVAELVGGRSSLAAVVFALALACGVALLWRGPRGGTALGTTGVALLLATVPALPVSTRMEPRYAMPAWIVVGVAFALGGARLAGGERRTKRAAAAIALAAVAGVSGLVLNRQDWSVRFARLERMSAEHRFMLEMRDEDVLRQPLTLAASLRELEQMKATVFGRPQAGRWFQDDLFLCLHPPPLGRVWGYDAEVRRVVDLTARVPDLRARYCASIRAAAPLTVTLRVTGQALFWDLGPYRAGTYRFVLGDGREAFEMPPRAGFRLPGWSSVPPLRVEYESPDGWRTHSPELRPQLVDGWSLRWSRP